MEQERLQKISKIMLATGTINYLATHIHTINSEMRVTNLAYEDSPHSETIHDQEQTLTKTLLHLEKAMDELADYMEAYDCLMPIDIAFTHVPFSIISGGMDEVNRDNFDPK